MQSKCHWYLGDKRSLLFSYGARLEVKGIGGSEAADADMA